MSTPRPAIPPALLHSAEVRTTHHGGKDTIYAVPIVFIFSLDIFLCDAIVESLS